LTLRKLQELVCVRRCVTAELNLVGQAGWTGLLSPLPLGVTACMICDLEVICSILLELNPDP
jgi:hypothetical protein